MKNTSALRNKVFLTNVSFSFRVRDLHALPRVSECPLLTSPIVSCSAYTRDMRELCDAYLLFGISDRLVNKNDRLIIMITIIKVIMI